MSRYPQLRSASIPALWAVQRHYGWCSPEGIRQAAAVMGVTPAYLESVATFYDLFATEPVGRHRVLVCHNISCWMNGADELLDAFCEAAAPTPRRRRRRQLADGEFFVRASSASAPATSRRWPRSTSATTGRSTRDDAVAAIEALRAGDEVLPDKALAERPAAGGPEPEPDPRVAEGEELMARESGCSFATSTSPASPRSRATGASAATGRSSRPSASSSPRT